MALNGTFDKIKQAYSNLTSRFFYDGNPPQPAPAREYDYAQQQQQPQAYDPAQYAPQMQYAPQQYAPQPDYQQQPQYAPQQQQVYAPVQQQYQPPQQQYQQPYAAPEQPPPQPFTSQYAAQFQPPQRNPRAGRHEPQEEQNNIVNFPTAQAQQYPPQQQGVPQQGAPMQPQGMPAAAVKVIQARSRQDCNNAILLLNNSEIVVFSMESLTDATEMRFYMDMLIGVCYLLNASITRVSTRGTYLLAPQQVSVHTDAATRQMNSAPRTQQPMAPAAGYQNRGASSYSQQFAAPQQPYSTQQPTGYYAQRGGEEYPNAPFYARPAAPQQMTGNFDAQPAGYGYVPDDVAVDQ